MELGIGMFGDLTFDNHNKKFQSASNRLKEMIEQVKLADDLGLDIFLLGEHHRPDYAVSSTEVVLSALSSVTKSIKLASGVTVLSSSDPVKVYQDFVTLDLLSNHRAEIIAGRGSFIESFPLYGFNIHDYHELFEEKLELLIKLNRESPTPVTWKGKFRSPLEKQIVYPISERKLPIWIGVGGTPESVFRAALVGLPVIFAIIGGRPKQFLPLIEYYKEEYLKQGHDKTRMQIGVHVHSFISESRNDLLENYFPDYSAQMNRIGKDRGWPAYTKNQFLNGLKPDGALYMGSPSEVIDKTLQTIEMFGLTRFIAHIDVGGPSHSQLMKTIEMYGLKVVPEIRKSLQK
ncbi:LLM class flavin-dependent oxidoreductase [Thermophagus sp. OGC60D27]|uniref:LLM class flavin-dependent oxidoreductase n=1 Tax=Thermophagus sp. OGC60D27 TaxID=3458415 RepID=UPI0040378D09